MSNNFTLPELTKKTQKLKNSKTQKLTSIHALMPLIFQVTSFRFHSLPSLSYLKSSLFHLGAALTAALFSLPLANMLLKISALLLTAFACPSFRFSVPSSMVMTSSAPSASALLARFFEALKGSELFYINVVQISESVICSKILAFCSSGTIYLVRFYSI